jgi:carbonic anhydrase/acetyltransferase-like protein (isoleucine patch superfamily)
MTVQDRLAKHLSKKPDTSLSAFVAASADVMGDVHLARDSSVFYGCVLRGDIQSIMIGEGTNIQDGTIIHLADDFGVSIGSYTTVGHGAMIHACKIGDRCLIGMRATVLDGAEIGNECIIGAGALVTKGTKVPEGSMVLGAPAKVARALTPEERAGLRHWAEKYVHVARAHAEKQAAGG